MLSAERALLWQTAAIVVSLVLLALAATPRGSSAQATRLSVDADSAGNGPTEVGPYNSCLSVTSGDTFDLDIIIEDVQELLAWEIYLEYDPKIVEIVQRDVRLFQGANPGSSVYDVSEDLPDSDGLYRLAAADTADPPKPDSGSGVLARLRLKAIASGISDASLARRDLDGDGKPDQGPFLRNTDGDPIGDDDGDTLFDGPDTAAKIAVDTLCSGSAGPASNAETNSDGDGLPIEYILWPALGAVPLSALSVYLILSRRRARAHPP